DRRRQRLRQWCIQHAFGAQWKRPDHATERIDDGGYSGIGHPDQREPFLDGADTGLLKMLIGTGAVAEPSVIGEVQEPSGPRALANHGGPVEIAPDVILQPSRSVAARHDLPRENDLVAD